MKLPKRTHHFDLNFDFNPLGRVDVAIILPDWIGTGFSRMRRWGSYQLVLLLKGEGIYRDTDGRDFQLKAGDLFITTPDVPHQYGPLPGKFWTEFVIGFRGSLFDLWNRAGILHPQPGPIRVKPLEKWYRKFRSIATPTEKEWREPIRHLARFQSLLEDLPLDKPYKRTYRWPDWMVIATQMIEAHDLAKPHSVATLANACGMGVHSFRRNFARLTGHGPVEYYQKYRIETASRLLATQRLSVKEIAEHLGFHDASHFSSAFKKHAGLSPRGFRTGKNGDGDRLGRVG